VKVHQHKVQEQVYHVIEGEGLMHIESTSPVRPGIGTAAHPK